MFRFSKIIAVYIVLLVLGYYGPKLNEHLNIFGRELDSLLSSSYTYKSISRNKCHLEIDDTYVGFPNDCIVINNPSNKYLFLIGDSHAWHLMPSIAKIAETQNYNLVVSTYSSCLYWPDVALKHPKKTGHYNECLNYVSNSIKDIENFEANEKVVLVSSDWSPHLFENKLFRQNIPIKHSELRIDSEFSNAKSKKKRFQRVVIVGPTPRTSFETIECIYSPNIERCESADNTVEYQRKLILLEVLKNHPLNDFALEFVVIDAFFQLCKYEKRCPIFNQSHLLYTDSNHISTFGALLLYDVLLASIDNQK